MWTPPTNTSALEGRRQQYKGNRKGKGDVRARLKRETCKQRALPAIILANVSSLHHKMDKLQACVNHRTASIHALKKSWLNETDDDGMPPHLYIRTGTVNTQHGGGECLYVISSWWEKLCTTDIKLLVCFTFPENFLSSFSFWFLSTPEST